MLLKIPFYKNVGSRCVQASMRSVIKYFLNKDLSLAKLDKLTGRKADRWTWHCQMNHVLYDMGLKVKTFGKTDLRPYLGGPEAIRKLHPPEEAEKMIEMMDFKAVKKAIMKVLKNRAFTNKILKFSELEDHLRKGHVPLMSIDINYFKGKKTYHGHMVILTGFTKKYVYCHDPGPMNPMPNKKVLKKRFIKAWKRADNRTTIVYGKRKGF